MYDIHDRNNLHERNEMRDKHDIQDMSFQDRYLERITFLKEHEDEINQIFQQRQRYITLLKQRIHVIQTLDRGIQWNSALEWHTLSSLTPRDIIFVDNYKPRVDVKLPSYIEEQVSNVLISSTPNQLSNLGSQFYATLIKQICNCALNRRNVKYPMQIRILNDRLAKKKSNENRNTHVPEIESGPIKWIHFSEDKIEPNVVPSSIIKYQESIHDLNSKDISSGIAIIETFLSDLVESQDENLDFILKNRVQHRRAQSQSQGMTLPLHEVLLQLNRLPQWSQSCFILLESFANATSKLSKASLLVNICKIRRQIRKSLNSKILRYSDMIGQKQSRNSTRRCQSALSKNQVEMEDACNLPLQKLRRYIYIHILQVNRSRFNSAMKRSYLHEPKYQKDTFSQLHGKHIQTYYLSNSLLLHDSRSLLELADLSLIISLLEAYSHIQNLDKQLQQKIRNDSRKKYPEYCLHLTYKYLLNKLHPLQNYYHDWLHHRLPQIIHSLIDRVSSRRYSIQTVQQLTEHASSSELNIVPSSKSSMSKYKTQSSSSTAEEYMPDGLTTKSAQDTARNDSMKLLQNIDWTFTIIDTMSKIFDTLPTLDGILSLRKVLHSEFATLYEADARQQVQHANPNLKKESSQKKGSFFSELLNSFPETMPEPLSEQPNENKNNPSSKIQSQAKLNGPHNTINPSFVTRRDTASTSNESSTQLYEDKFISSIYAYKMFEYFFQCVHERGLN